MGRALYIFTTLVLFSGSACANPDNPADMEQYIIQCPNVVAARAELKSANDILNKLQAEKSDDENQQLINNCKAINYAKDVIMPKFINYTKTLDECSRNGYPILKRMVNNLSISIQQMQVSARGASAECN